MNCHETESTDLDHPGRRPAIRAFTVQPGMEVRSSDGVFLGLIHRLFMDAGSISDILVAHQPGDRWHKRLDFQMVGHLEGETVILSMTAAEFRLLPEYNPDQR